MKTLRSMILAWDGIDAEAAEGVTPREPAGAEPDASQRPVLPYRLRHVVSTRGCEAAASGKER